MSSSVIQEDIIHFLQTGALAHFPFGTTKDMVIKQLGETIVTNNPNWPKRRSCWDRFIMKYDKVEFYFGYGVSKFELTTLNGIVINPAARAAYTPSLQVNYHWITPELTHEEAKKHLQDAHIECTETISSYDKVTTYIITNSGVTLSFSPTDATLEKVSKFINS